MAIPSLGIMPVPTSTRSTDETATWAESAGFDSVWLSEGWGRDALMRSTEIACSTSEITIGTSIVNTFSRSPATLAAASATLDEISNQRFILGVGPSHTELIEGLHGLKFERPVQRTHETVELVREYTRSNGPVNYSGEIFEVGGYDSLGADIPIYASALGPANRRMVGALCDGWLPYNIPFSDLASSFETVSEAARAADRNPEAITVAPWVPVLASDDVETARAAVRQSIAGYVGTFENYKNAIGRRYSDSVEKVTTAWGADNQDAAADAVTDEMVNELAIVGTAPDITKRLVEFCDREVVDHPIVTFPRTAEDTLIDNTAEAIAANVLSTS